MKLCKDCKWCSIPEGALEKLVETEYRCRHFISLGDINLITGYQQSKSCYEMRKYDICGENAKLFEDK